VTEKKKRAPLIEGEGKEKGASRQGSDKLSDVPGEKGERKEGEEGAKVKGYRSIRRVCEGKGGTCTKFFNPPRREGKKSEYNKSVILDPHPAEQL